MAEGTPSTTRLTGSGAPGAVRRKATSADSTFGRGRKTSRETGWKPVRSVASCTSTDRAVRLRGRLSEETVGDLALHHHAPARDLLDAEAFERSAAWRCCRAGSRRACAGGGSRREMSRRIASPQWTVVRSIPVRCGLETFVDLDRVHVGDPLGEKAGQDAEPRPDLEHDVGAVELGEPLDHAEDVLVDQEVLAERLPRRDAHSPKTASAFASIWPRIAVVVQLREKIVCVDDVGRLVALASDGLRREVRAVGLGEQPVGGDLAGGGSQVVGVLVGDVPGERDVPAAFERDLEQVRRGEAVENDRPVVGAQGARACRRRRRACGSRPAFRAHPRARAGFEQTSPAPREARSRGSSRARSRRPRPTLGWASSSRSSSRSAGVGRLMRMDAETGVDAVLPLGPCERLARGRRRCCDIDHPRDPGRARTREHLGRIVAEVRVRVDHDVRGVRTRGKSGGAASTPSPASGDRMRRAPSRRSVGWPSASRILRRRLGEIRREGDRATRSPSARS